ncbi:hypothetical protein, partial [Endozoicomonas sp. ONNA2]|uniref:hypothetical protein n=1 Tax=Endozoicomonas sp. ONNA2 TaxID=2828741 RepID=UPI0021491C63
MDLHLLNGLTPEQLRALITESPVGFSAEDGSIQYLGRQIQLLDGMITLSGQTFNTTASKQLFERMVSLQPDFQQQLPGSTSEAIEMTARNLVDKFQYEAIEKSPTKEVLCAVFIEFMKFNIINPINTAIKLSETHSLTGAEKLRILLAAEDQRESPLPMECWSIAGIPLSIRLEEAKNRFQRFPATPSLAQEANEINEYLTALNPDTQIKEGLLEIRQTLVSENNELSRQLLGEVDNIEKIFIARVIKRGYFTVRDDIDFKIHSRRLLHLYAACSGFSPDADIAELASYIRAVLYTSDYNIWHITQELVYLSKQPGSMNYCRYINAVANTLKAPAYFVSQFEECKQLSDINGFALLESKPLATYLMELRANIGNMTPEYSQVLLPAVNHLESKVAGVSLPEGKPEIKAKVHRLLLVIAACKSSEQIMDTSVLAHFVSVIMEHGNIKNIPYLISGLTR